MKITMKAIITNVYVSPKTQAQYISLTDMENGGTLSLESRTVDFSKVGIIPVTIIAEIKPGFRTQKEGRPQLALEVLSAAISKEGEPGK